MIVRVLGAAAGGGLPQWNCGCPNCGSARGGDERVAPRTQSSVAVSADGRSWTLLNASPDIRQQIHAFPPLGPGRRLRGSGIRAVVLTDAEIDHSLGLLLMREAKRLVVYTTPAVREALTTGHPLLPTLGAYCEVEWRRIGVEPGREEARLDGLDFPCTAFDVPGDPPSYSRRPPTMGDVVGLELAASGGPGERGTVAGDGDEEGPDGAETLVYVPGTGAIDARLRARIARSRVTLLDGTFWTNEEMSTVGQGGRTAADMHHLPVSGSGGSLERLSALHGVRRIYVHINNTNPVLMEGSSERRAVEEAGFEVAYDGMEIRLGEHVDVTEGRTPRRAAARVGRRAE